MAAVAVANLDILDSSMKKQKRLSPNVRGAKSKEEEKRRAIKSYLKTIERGRKKNVMKKTGRQNIKVKRPVPSSNEANKKEALKSCLQTVRAARNQLNEELLLELKKQYHLELEVYEAQSLEFLKIPDSIDMWSLVEHLKKYYVVVEQMMQEHNDNNEYHDSLKNARNQISQLMETLELTAMFITGKISSKNGYPSLPDELKIESSRSLRQNRDYLFVKEYKNILEIIDEFLKERIEIVFDPSDNF